MKFIFSIIVLTLLSSAKAFCRDIIFIENQSNHQDGEVVVKILTQKFHLPSELITLRDINGPCEKRSEAIIHLCIDQEGELQIEKMNHYVVRNSLEVFMKDVQWDQL
jgi:hypothetical protein